MLTAAIEKIQEISPDLIVLTGDFVTLDPNPIHELVSRIKHLPSRYGMVAVLGNHDIEAKGARRIVTEALEKSQYTGAVERDCNANGGRLPSGGVC